MKPFWCVTVSVAALVAGSTLGASALAQHIYTCRDSAGHQLTSDRPIAECANLPMRELSSQGTLIHEIAPPMTPAQQAEKAEQMQKQREADEAQREQHRRDQALLSTYNSEASLEAARHRALGEVEDTVRDANAHLGELMRDQQGIKQDTDALHGKPVPPKLQKRIDDNTEAIALEQRTLADARAAMDRTNLRFDADIARYRALRAAAAPHP